MMPTVNNTGHRESTTRRATMKTEMVRWYLQQQHQMAEQLRRNHGGKN